MQIWVNFLWLSIATRYQLILFQRNQSHNVRWTFLSGFFRKFLESSRQKKTCFYLQALFTFSVLSHKSGNFDSDFWDKRLFKMQPQFVLRTSVVNSLLWDKMFSVKFEKLENWFLFISERKCLRRVFVLSLWTRKKDQKAVINL